VSLYISLALATVCVYFNSTAKLGSTLFISRINIMPCFDEEEDYYERQWLEDRAKVIKWSQNLIAGKYGDWCCLDTETTGLYEPEIVDIAIVSKYGSSFINTLVKCQKEIEQEAQHIHGISHDMLCKVPSFTDIYPRLTEILENRLVVIYNKDFDNGALFNCCKVNQLPRIKFKSVCAMRKYAVFYGDYSRRWGNYTWQKLPNANHRAYGDAKACYNLIHEMANAPMLSEYENSDKPELLFPPFQIGCDWKEVGSLNFRSKCLQDYGHGEYQKAWELLKISIPSFYFIKNGQKINKDED
jgi:DNA polymerase III epsilon subunit-like protein